MARDERIDRYIGERAWKLKLLRRMWADPRVQLYNDRALPPREELEDGAAFLAGPTSRHQILEYNWRCEAVAHLREEGFRGYIYAPEPRGAEEEGDFTEREYIHRWESDRLFAATHAVFWIPRRADELLGLNTNLELGIFLGRILFSTRGTSIYLGWPPEAERMGLPQHYALNRAGCRRFKTLRALCSAVAGKLELE